jgi:predicted AAA+ superfamily ATPase
MKTLIENTFVRFVERSRLFHASESRALALLGARQVGKTTLSRAYAAQHNCPYFDLEDPEAIQALTETRAAFQDLLGQLQLVSTGHIRSDKRCRIYNCRRIINRQTIA